MRMRKGELERGSGDAYKRTVDPQIILRVKGGKCELRVVSPRGLYAMRREASREAMRVSSGKARGARWTDKRVDGEGGSWESRR